MLSMLINGLSVGAVYSTGGLRADLLSDEVQQFCPWWYDRRFGVYWFFASKWFHTNLFLTLLIAMVGGGITGLVVELIGFRRMRGKNSPLIYYFISSITIGMLLENILTLINGTNFYTFPTFIQLYSFDVFGFMVNIMDCIMMGVTVVSLLTLLYIFRCTRLGLAIRAVSLDNRTSRLCGINSTVVVMAAFFIAGALAGICGVLLGINYTVYPQLSQMVVKGFIASVLGGLGSLGGAVVGALLLGVIEVFVTVIFGAGLTPVFSFGIIILFLLIRPQGIAGVIVSEKA